MKNAVAATKSTERQHASAMRSKEKQNFTTKMMDYDKNKTGLLDRTLSAEKKWRTSEKKAHCASRRLKDVREVGDNLEMQVVTLSNENE